MNENGTFLANPLSFVQSHPVNVLNFRAEGVSSRVDSDRLVAVLNQQKCGYFNLVSRGVFSSECILRGHPNAPTGWKNDPWIDAYWLPYVPAGTQGAGIGNVPFVDLPRSNPQRRLLFTGAMNGCSLVVTSGQTPTTVRVHHDSRAQASAVYVAAGLTVLARLDYDGSQGSPYHYNEGVPANAVVNAFNFMQFLPDGVGWCVVYQPQSIVGAADDPPKVASHGAYRFPLP